MRRKIGLLVPAANTTIEPDFMAALPDTVSFHSTRIYSKTQARSETQESVDEINDAIPEFIDVLSRAHPEILVYGFTAGSFYRGIEHALALKKRIETLSGAAAVLSSLAILEALEHLDAQKISVITPYLEWNYLVLKEFLKQTKYEILNITRDDRPQAISLKDRLTRQEPDNIIKHVLEHSDKNADTIVLPCTAWRAFEAAPAIERETNRRVVTANQAILWSAFKLLKINPRNKTATRLFRETGFV